MTAERSTSNADELRPRGVVVGASLAGLTTALALARTGMRVLVLERSGRAPRNGAAMAVDLRDLARVTGDPSLAGPRGGWLPYAWTDLQRMLLRAAEASPLITCQFDTSVAAAGTFDDGAWVRSAGGERISGDFVVGADGHASVVRAAVDPVRPHADYAGYTLWLGVVEEHELGNLRRWPREVDILQQGSEYLFGYPLAPVDGTSRLGWALYDASRSQLLRRLGAVEGSVVRRTLGPNRIPEATYAELRRGAARWPTPWRDAMLHSIDTRNVISTPIAEYVPERLVRGRLALVGNAAHVPSPMTGRGLSEAIADADVLAAAFEQEQNVSEALQSFERNRLLKVRDLVESGRRFSRSFAPATFPDAPVEIY